MDKNNKGTFATNLRRLMDSKGKSRREISDVLGISYYTISDWVNGKKYPRMDKVELLANYFGVLKSELIEERVDEIKIESDELKLTDGEKMMVDLFRQIPESKQSVVLEMIRLALKTQE